MVLDLRRGSRVGRESSREPHFRVFLDSQSFWATVYDPRKCCFPQCPPLQNGDDNNIPLTDLGDLNELIYVNISKQCLVGSKCNVFSLNFYYCY